ncbi:hypothetical protein E2C06_33505 [Dankookia rubra]|uniref:Uncharacterized protein n=1 Tax=Dankookia rubra TaxID=1442381 RepID=A0A4R5Q6E2_9PROT|nr:hypothetical protein [Dankookia rubra]TDH58266.1 hypothetical protein E2C06_33505 [Dankookia rubra]
MDAPCPDFRLIERDDVLLLIEELRANHPARQWPTIRETQSAARNRWRVGIGSDRARILLHEAQAGDQPPDAEVSETPAIFGKRVHAQAARAARIRRRQARLMADGSTPERTDEVRQLLTECHTKTLQGAKNTDEVVEPLVAWFEASERRRLAVLQDRPEPAPQVASDVYTIRDDPRQTHIETAIALSTQNEPDTAPDILPPPAPDAVPNANQQLLGLLTS